NRASKPVKSPPVLTQNTAYDSLDLAGTDIKDLPEGISVRFALILRDCKKLERLPTGLKVGTLDIAGCTSLKELPEKFSASFLDMSDCRQIEWWPDVASLSVGRLRARNCAGLTG